MPYIAVIIFWSTDGVWCSIILARNIKMDTGGSIFAELNTGAITYAI